MAQDIAIPKLERGIRDLKEDVIKLNSTCDTDSEELLKIIHRPGWTTPAEFLLVSNLVESMHADVRILIGQFGILMSASREIAGEKVGR